MAVAAGHRVHDGTPSRPGAAQRTRWADRIVAVAVRPSVQGVYGHLSTQVANEPANRGGAGAAERRDPITDCHRARDGVRRAESFLACFQGSRWRATWGMAARASPIIWSELSSYAGGFRQYTAGTVNT